MRAWLHRSGPSEEHANGGWAPAGWAAAIALVAALLALDRAPPEKDDQFGPQLTQAQRAVQDQCVEGALLFHDVLWAASCARLAEQGASDGHAECELPPAESDRLHRQLQQAEQRCWQEAARAPSP